MSLYRLFVCIARTRESEPVSVMSRTRSDALCFRKEKDIFFFSLSKRIKSQNGETIEYTRTRLLTRNGLLTKPEQNRKAQIKSVEF